jgi:hypothetical protein
MAKGRKGRMAEGLKGRKRLKGLKRRQELIN